MNSLEFESNFEEIIYAKLCGHTPQACASPSELAWTSRDSGIQIDYYTKPKE
jgi:hypothetical protein